MKFTTGIVIGTLVLSTVYNVECLAATSIPQSAIEIKENINQQTNSVEVKNELVEKQNKSNIKMNISAIKFDTELIFNHDEVNMMAKSYLNKIVTLKDVNELAGEITSYFRRKGYPAAVAYIPAQKIGTDRVLVIGIIPGRYGNIKIDNNSRLNMKVIKRFTDSMKTGDIITSKNLETILYNLNDYCGVNAKGVLSPGKNIGTSNLNIAINDGNAESTVLYMENYGNDYVGRYRYNILTDFYDVGNTGDHIAIHGIMSNKDMYNYAINYEKIVGNNTKIGISGSHMNYELSGAFTVLGAQGKADIFTIYGQTPLWKTNNSSLSINYGLDYKKLNDEYKSFSLDSERHSNSIYAGINGYNKTELNNTNYDLTLYTGKLVLDSDFAKYNNTYNHTEGDFSKMIVNINSVEKIAKDWDILLKFQGQLASSNLDSSEQMYLGGANGVRAYPRGEGAGDEGCLGTAELRYHTKVPGLTLSTYFDTGNVKVLKDGSYGSKTLNGWGIGLTYIRPNNYFMRFDYARRIGIVSDASSDDQAHNRMWFMVGKVL